MRLADVCKIHMVFTVRHRLEPVEETGMKAIYLRDVMFRDEINPASLKTTIPSLAELATTLSLAVLAMTSSRFQR